MDRRKSLFVGATQPRCWGDTTPMLGRRNFGWGNITWGDKAMGRHNLHSPILTVIILWINPIATKSDQHLISPYNITLESLIEVTRIKQMITNETSSSLLN